MKNQNKAISVLYPLKYQISADIIRLKSSGPDMLYVISEMKNKI